MSSSPIRVHALNVTPASRTPWGGHKIVAAYKHALVPDLPPAFSDAPWDALPFAQRRIGESWEFSLDHAQPSRCEATDIPLYQRMDADPVAWLGAAIAQHAGQSTLQIKIIDAADDLSLQVHPAWASPALREHESGKFETWIVLDAEPDAAIYLGLLPGVDEARIREAIAADEDISRLLHRISVRAGDSFHVRGGTPHAIGKGVLLLEPQAVQPGKTPLTYRFWDWNRRYDAQGEQSPAGAPRALAVDASMDTIDWSVGQRPHFAATQKLPAETIVLFGGGKVVELAETPWFRVERIVGTGDVALPPLPTLAVMLCLHGQITVTSDAGGLVLRQGQTGIFPATSGRLECHVEDADVYVVRERSEWVPRG